MNKTLKLAFGAVLGSMLVFPAYAQGEQFPDVPENHWVYQALLNMKNEGVLVGYPDGLFRGGRPASRYELAGAINAAYQKLRGMITDLQSQIDAIKDMGDLAAIRRELDALKAQLANMPRYDDDIAALRRMAETFQKDLTNLGVDVEAMKKDLSDLARRVGELEKRKPAVDIHGDVNLVMHAGHGEDGLFGLTVDARPTGYGRGAYAGTVVGMDRDLTIGHEAGFQLSGTNETGPQWHTTLVVGNLIGFAGVVSGDGGPSGTIYGNQSMIQPGTPFLEGATNVYFQDFGVSFNSSIWGQGFTAELGRFGHKSGRFFFQRIDNTPYFENPRWDDGNYYMDGVNLGFGWGGLNLDVWGGRNSSQLASDPIFTGSVWPLEAGPQNFFAQGELSINRSLGFDAGFRLGQTADVMLHYIFLDSDSVNTTSIAPISGDFNRVNVWGGEVNFNLGGMFNVNAGYSQTDLKYNESTVLDDDNNAWWAAAGFNVGNVGVNIGYRRIEPWFGAPGDWGRVGFLWNPVDHQGVFGDVTFNFLNNVNAKISAYSYEGLDGAILPADSQIRGINAEANMKIFGDWGLLLGTEYVEYDLGGTARGTSSVEPIARWYRIGLNHSMGNGSMFSLKYEISRYSDEGGFLGSFGLPLNQQGDRRGGFLTTQWTTKF